MKKIFTLLTLCLLASAAWALDITFVAGVDNGTSDGTAKPFYIEKEGIRIDISNGLANSSHYRIYKNQTATFTSSIGAITQIVFECTANGDAQYGPGCFTVEPGSYSYQDKIGTWTGSASPVVFTAATNQVRATKIIVTVGNPGLSAPTITPAAGTYYSPIQVNITCGTPGAKIYYTTNGSAPSTSSTEFTAPFTVNSDMTVKAISAKDGETSDVVEAAYEFKTATPVANIAAYQGVDDGTVVVFSNPVSVLAQSGQRMFVQDGTGRALFYGNTGQTYNNGDVIPAGFVGTKTTWDGEPELTDLTNFQPASGNSPISPDVITTVDVDASLFAQYVLLNVVTFDKTNKLVKDANGEAAYYCNMNVKDADIAEGVEYNLYAIVGSHGKAPNTVYQLLPVKIEKVGGPDPGDLIGFGKLPEIADNEEVTMEYDITVFGQVGSYLYAMDETGYGLIFGSVGQTYQFGDVVPKGFTGTKTTWDGEPELKNPGGLQPATGNVGATLTPHEITPAQVNHDVWGQYVLLRGVKIDTQAKTLSKNGETCPYYPDRFGVEMPNDGADHDVYGIVASYGKAPNTVYQILPISIDEPPVPDTTKPEVKNLQELYQLPKGKIAVFTEPLTAIYQNKDKRDLYIIDSNGEFGLVYGDVDGNFVNGDYINGAEANWTTYNDNKQLAPVGNTFVKAGHGTPVQPVIMPIEEVSLDCVHWYCGFENTTVFTKEENEKVNYYITDETGAELMLFDRYSIGVADLDLGKTYYVEGFLTNFKGTLELYPIKASSGLIGDVNGDGEVNIADINAAIDMILIGDQSSNGDVNGDGEVNIADINAIIDIILNS